MEELFNAANAMAKQPLLSGDNVVIVSNVGGPAILAAEAVVKNGLKLAVPSERTKKEIERRYPGVDVVNPVDLVADARTERCSTVLDLVLSDLTWTESRSSRCLRLVFLSRKTRR